MENNEPKKKTGTCFTQVHPKGEANFDTVEDADCFCPQCGRIYTRKIDINYTTNPDIWKMDGLIVIRCKACKARKEYEADRENGVEIEAPQLAVMQMRSANRINNNGGGEQ